MIADEKHKKVLHMYWHYWEIKGREREIVWKLRVKYIL